MKKHRTMVKRPELRRYLLETHWLVRGRTSRMLKSYPSVFIKPNHGSGGSGIIRVRKLRDGYELRCGMRRKNARLRSLYKAINSYRRRSDSYLIQRGIRLAKYKGSIFDVRVYMQKPGRQWGISGMVARVAAPNRFVTNYYQGGRAKPLGKVLMRVYKHNRMKASRRLMKIKKVSHTIADTIYKRFGGSRELGIDIAIDRNGRMWIIEANSRPGHMLFTKLRDKSMLRTIMINKHRIKRRK